MIFKNLASKRKKIVTSLCENDIVSKLLYYETNDALQKPSLKNSEKAKLINNKILITPFFQLNEDESGQTTSQSITMMSITFGNIEPYDSHSKSLCEIPIEIRLCINNDLAILNNGSLRGEILCDEIHKFFFTSANLLGIGKIEFEKVISNIRYTDTMYGYVLKYVLVDFDVNELQ